MEILLKRCLRLYYYDKINVVNVSGEHTFYKTIFKNNKDIECDLNRFCRLFIYQKNQIKYVYIIQSLSIGQSIGRIHMCIICS